jgi:hypothetical protein
MKEDIGEIKLIRHNTASAHAECYVILETFSGMIAT